MRKYSGPSIIGVGPEKTGTTWIDRQLRGRPDVLLPPIKELRYFWEKYAFPRETALARLDYKKSWHHEQYRAYIHSRLRSIVRDPVREVLNQKKRFLWDL